MIRVTNPSQPLPFSSLIFSYVPFPIPSCITPLDLHFILLYPSLPCPLFDHIIIISFPSSLFTPTHIPFITPSPPPFPHYLLFHPSHDISPIFITRIYIPSLTPSLAFPPGNGTLGSDALRQEHKGGHHLQGP